MESKKKLSACTSFICVAAVFHILLQSIFYSSHCVCMYKLFVNSFPVVPFYSFLSFLLFFLIKFFCSHTRHNLYYIYSFLLLLPAFSAVHSCFLSFPLSVLFNRKQTVSSSVFFFFFVEKGGLAIRVREEGYTFSNVDVSILC